ncbi:MAG: FAD-dependent monooxygenase [Phenylobacterium sp.]|uniref:FAD-dependent oxidoreductase n=1 Tax=Phenylobacterium sp. TaxID=1871053 RepID=UPI0025FA192E|nr:FAD-dependent oxidoreductase [Phenylobacterium sp.]MCA6298327.1 FAD-dependent monooxygenase [Phenylobacterium sp.]
MARELRDYDLIVVGGGIGGGALSTVMARAGSRVLLLEQTETYVDRVRGEWIAPWGVVETRTLGLYDTLMAAGGHHLRRHITYDETLSPRAAEAAPLPLDIFAPGVPGPLCLRHPVHCQALFDAAKAAGADARRGVAVTGIRTGTDPCVTFEDAGETFLARAPLVVGADGRTSAVREAAGIPLHQDAPHHWFAGLLVEGVEGWPEDTQAIGTEGDFGFLAFPQGDGKVRVYGGFALDQARRFQGPDGARRFLDAFAVSCSPGNARLVAGRPAGPVGAFINADSWTDAPFAMGAVLVGDAAGWNDPIIGLGMSITYRDVRIVSDLLKSVPAGRVPDFSSYATERAERMRRLRFTARIQAALDMEFGPEAAARRKDLHDRSRIDPGLKAHAFAVMAGPETVPAELFTEAHRARVLGLSEAAP